MLNPLLHVLDGVAGVALVPASVEILGNGTELHDQVVREVFRFDLAALLPPQPNEIGFVIAQNHASIGSANERAAVNYPRHVRLHSAAPGTIPGKRMVGGSVNGTKRAFCGVVFAEPGPAAKEDPANCKTMNAETITDASALIVILRSTRRA